MCNVDRTVHTGWCRSGASIIINRIQLHHGEEPVISGTRGSGTIFFSNCNLSCVYCQNYTISQQGWGRNYSESEVTAAMLQLQDAGAHNINLVTPTHFTAQLQRCIQDARTQGLEIPIIWNTNSYEDPAVLAQMEGLIDIYLADLRYARSDASLRYSAAADYPQVARKAIKEMVRQVGWLKTDDDDLAWRGVLIRLLMLPGNVNHVEESLRWIADELGPQTPISLMAQYYPAWQAHLHPEINRGITPQEYAIATRALEELGMCNGFVQEVAMSPHWTPDFTEQGDRHD
jgi:putative pyruvate formate lyase activating enzyme